ncbi:type IV toxin-antitoxin system AbiEi family antitoxin domain-containing protein [Chitinophaga sp. 22321]|uniref:Transcriptional regulator, AbiEi antitoxin, Type IV TA system n=1 Tax=Chitinophaga hostae TaxID=2831022 RepID=A0ABS5JB36_9BACT|nr:hypothetical protein [Chitinophaga hostae]MBS0032418.1 hypothetical protein [Chitinophaga hostae]
MEINQALQSHAWQPLTHQLLLSLLKDYKRPNDKIHNLLNEGVLESIRKGLYIAGPALKTGKPEPFLLANHILGPSYVSIDTALSYYGLIPERVFEYASMTTKDSRKFQTPMGVFSYAHLSLPYYSFGIQQVKLSKDQIALIASPEKALCDRIVITKGIELRSQKDAMNYLLEDMRMDEENLKELNTSIMQSWIEDAPKKEKLHLIIKTIKRL